MERIPDDMKLDAVEIAVLTNVLPSCECNPLTKYLQTRALAASMRMRKTMFCNQDGF